MYRRKADPAADIMQGLIIPQRVLDQTHDLVQKVLLGKLSLGRLRQKLTFLIWDAESRNVLLERIEVFLGHKGITRKMRRLNRKGYFVTQRRK